MSVCSLPSRAMKRCAFTLVELLVVIAIIAVLVGLLLPAVNSVRESGRRTQCTNNVYQAAIAAAAHNDANGYLPGWRHAAIGSLPFPSWPVVLLPFLDQKNTYAAIASGGTVYPAISGFKCPASPPADANVPSLAYAGNCGSGGLLPGTTNVSNRWDGVMVDVYAVGSNAALRVDVNDISGADGVATTLLLAEKAGAVTGLTPGTPLAFWSASLPNGSLITDGTCQFAGPSPGPAVPGIGIGVAGPNPNDVVINSKTAGSPGAFSQPSSNHPGGVVVAFCDGHTDFVKESIAADVYAQILSWNHLKASTTSRITWQANSKFPLSDTELD